MTEISWPWQYNFPPFFTIMMKLLGHDWSYINEGNSHIVLQLKDTEFVLRIIKEGIKPVAAEYVYDSVDFANFVMTPLLFDDNKCPQEAVAIPPKEFKEFSKWVQSYPLRPENRRKKSKPSGVAIKTLNLTLLSPTCQTNYCVEIKPKEGFLAQNLRQLSKCYYCLKQKLKLEQGDIEAPSLYCPLDLFSGNKDRMKRALMNLIDNPQNNIKLFENGKVIYQAGSSMKDFDDFIVKIGIFNSIMQFLEFIIEILLKDHKAENYTFEDMFRSEAQHPLKSKDECIDRSNLNSHKFYNSILYKLIQLQKLSENKEVDVTALDKESIEYVGPLLKQIKSQKLNLYNKNNAEEFVNSFDPLTASLISAAAKDCSIMICFTANLIEGFPFIKLGKKKISYRLAVTDIEPKTPKSLIRRQQTESKLFDLHKVNHHKIQPHTETRAKQLEAWQELIINYLKANKLSTIDIRESLNTPLFNNTAIERKLSQESVLTILEDMARAGRAAPVDKSKTVWEVYWHSLDEWGNMVYNWASVNGMTNSVCTLFELREGENTTDEEFHGLDMNVLMKALKALEAKGKCEMMEFDDSQGVKFF